MTYYDHGYRCPSVRPRVSDPATYCSSTPRIQLPAVARWHTHLRSLETPIHKICGLGNDHVRLQIAALLNLQTGSALDIQQTTPLSYLVYY